MTPDNEWDQGTSERTRFDGAGMSALRITLLFGSAAVALALIVAPLLEEKISAGYSNTSTPQGLDMASTGSVGYKGSYTIRRSVLQDSPNSICVIRDNGTRSGDC